MQLVVGTYERFLLGYKLPEDLQEACQLQRSFTHAAHQGPVRCLDAAGSYVVSGGQDDQLHIYDVKKNQDLGFMMNPGDGAIPCLQFYTPPNAQNPTHLFSGSDDGSIAIWKAGGGWEHLKLMRGHKGPVRSLSLHPSGRLALSVGHDRALRMWNLAKGRCSYTAKLEAEADYIGFSPDGESYALLCDKQITIHSVGEEGSITAKLQHQRRAVSLLQQQDGAAGLVLSGLDDGKLCLWDLRAAAADQPVWEVERAHNGRIRAIVTVTPGDTGSFAQHIATASSDGVIKLWDSRALSSSSGSGRRLLELASISTQGRITGMALSAPERKVAAAAAAAAVGSGGRTAAAAAAAAAVTKAANVQGTGRKQKRSKQQQQQQQPEADAPGEVRKAAQQQQKQQQQQQQQQHKAAAPQQPPHRQQQKKQQRKQQKQAAAGGAAAAEDAADGALVPRVQTKIMKKKKKPDREHMQRAITAAVGGKKPAKQSQRMQRHKLKNKQK